MKDIHRIVFWATHAQIAELADLGTKPDSGMDSFDKTQKHTLIVVPEDHPNWPLIRARMREWENPFHTVYTVFNERELESARWLCLHAWNNGFPQPQDLEGYARVTYDLSRWCNKCASGKVQNAPFRLKGEPKWNRRGIMTTFWTLDEFFVPPAVWETVFKPFGITCRPVANRKGVELKTVVQLVVDEEVDIVTDGLKPLPCEACGHIRYEWPVRGMFPALTHEPTGAMAKSRQPLGHGWSFRAVFISQELVRALKAHNVRGAELTPVDAALPAFVA